MSLYASIRSLFRRNQLEADMAEEMQGHLERRTEANIAAGMSPEEARYAAQRQFGGIEQLKEIARDQRGLRWLQDGARDLRLAFRGLRKAPAFAGTTILILALGIGGVTAMFSTLYDVMIRPLPYPAADRLVLGRATFSGQINPMVAGPDYLDHRNQSRSFSALGAFLSQPFEMTVSDGQNPERVACLRVTAGVFQALGVRTGVGRIFTADDEKPGGSPVAMISHAYWRRHFGAATDVTRLTLTVDGVSRAVVGVLPPDFFFYADAAVWLPAKERDLGPRRYNNWLMVGRLADGVGLADAQQEIDVIAARLEKAYPDTNTSKGLLLTPLQGALAEQYRSGLTMLCGGALAVLLIACANAAGLLLARGAAREGELAMRAAMGASHWQIMRLLLAEALALALAGGILGTVFALWIERALMRLFSAKDVLVQDGGISGPVLLFVFAVTLLTGLAAGLVPALRLKRPDLAQAVKTTGRGNSRHGTALRGGLVSAQVALSFVLLVVAGLLTRSLASLHRTDPGFDPDNLLTMEVPLPSREYNPAQRTQFFASLLENIRAVPGVRSAAAISQLPLRNGGNDISIYDVSTPPVSPSDASNGYQRVVLPGYFDTMSIRLIAGRDIAPSDSQTSARVVVVSETLAASLFPGQNPLGRRVVVDRETETPWEVVGVVSDVKAQDLRQASTERGAFYRPHAQLALPMMRFAIRTGVDPHALVPQIRDLLRKADHRVPLSGPRTMREVMDNATVSERALTLCLGAFSLLAVVLAAVGIHGVLAYRVTQQRRDIGIRMALGADHGAVAWGVLRQACTLAIIGGAIGMLGAFAMLRVLRSHLYGIGSYEPIVFIGSALVLILIAGFAAWFPVLRATRVNPIEALRAE